MERRRSNTSKEGNFSGWQYQGRKNAAADQQRAHGQPALERQRRQGQCSGRHRERGCRPREKQGSPPAADQKGVISHRRPDVPPLILLTESKQLAGVPHLAGIKHLHLAQNPQATAHLAQREAADTHEGLRHPGLRARQTGRTAEVINLGAPRLQIMTNHKGIQLIDEDAVKGRELFIEGWSSSSYR